LEYSDGFKIFAWHGAVVPEWIIREPEKISVSLITAELNAEVRRVMIERYGLEKFIKDSGATKVHQDALGVLWRKNLPGDEALVMVQVKNSTAEPDGTYKHYFLRVPPDTRTVRAAVAWTFGLMEHEYKPRKET